MTALASLTGAQWSAAFEAARVLGRCNPRDADDRKAFREAKARLADVLPADADARQIIDEAVRWDALNTLAGTLAGVPGVTIEQFTREPGCAQQATPEARQEERRG